MAAGEIGKFVNKVKQSAISVAGDLAPVLKVHVTSSSTIILILNRTLNSVSQG
jgi:hypothetical protein